MFECIITPFLLSPRPDFVPFSLDSVLLHLAVSRFSSYSILQETLMSNGLEPILARVCTPRETWLLLALVCSILAFGSSLKAPKSTWITRTGALSPSAHSSSLFGCLATSQTYWVWLHYIFIFILSYYSFYYHYDSYDGDVDHHDDDDDYYYYFCCIMLASLWRHSTSSLKQKKRKKKKSVSYPLIPVSIDWLAE